MNGINEEIERVRQEIADIKQKDELKILVKERNRLLNKSKWIYKIWEYLKTLDKK